MGEMSVFASKFKKRSLSLREFDEVLRFLREDKYVVKTKEIEEQLEHVLKITQPISEVIKGNLSNSTSIDEKHLVKNIKQRHEKEWYSYKNDILDLNSKLKKSEFTITKKDINILNDIADALDINCGNLFKRISEI